MNRGHFPSSSTVDGMSDKRKMDKLKLLFHLTVPYRRQLILATLSLSLAAGMVLSLGWCIQHLIDHGFGQSNAVAMDAILLMMGGAVILLAVASFGRSYFISWVGERVTTDLRQRVFDHILHLNISFFETVRPEELVSRIITDTTLIQTVLGGSAAAAVRNFLLLLGGLVMMCATSLKLTLLTILIVPVVLIPILIYGRRVRLLSRKTQEHIGDMSGFLEETLAGIRTTQAFMHEYYDQAHFKERSEDAFGLAIRRNYLKSLLACLVMVLVFGGVSLVLWIGSRDVLSSQLDAGQLSAFIFYAIVVASAAGSFAEIVTDVQRAVGAVDRLRSLLDIPSTPSLTWDNKRKLPSPSIGVVAMHNVCFAYPNNPDKPVVNNVTLSASPGEKLPLLAHLEQAKAPSYHYCSGFTRHNQGLFILMALMFGKLISVKCVAALGLYLKIRSSLHNPYMKIYYMDNQQRTKLK